MGKAKDYTGQKFGRLMFVKPTEKRREGGGIVWELLCDCNNVVFAYGSDIARGAIKSCGCSNIEALTGNQRNRSYDPHISSARIVWKSYLVIPKKQ